MKIVNSLALGATFISSVVFAASGVATPTRLYTWQHENVLGTSFEIKLAAASETAARQGEAAALAEIDRQAKILSAYDLASEFSRWTRSRNQAVKVSPELLEVLGLFDQWRIRTNGGLDASAEAIGRVWKTAGAAGRIPTGPELQAAVQAVKRTHWSLDRAAGTATHLSDTPLALNSFAKSYILGHAADAALSADGVTAVVLNIGGDLVIRGALTEPVNLADPVSDSENTAPIAHLLVRNRAIATSGNYRRGVQIGDRFYSHIVDPRTGQPVDHVISSTVIAADPATAGALATAFSVLTVDESRRLAATLTGVEYLLLERNGHRVESAGWTRFEAPKPRLAAAFAAKPAPAPAPQASGAAWDSSMELTIHLELARLDNMRARRPYVAAWIEDKDKFPLKTLALWFDKSRWLPELRAWNRDERMRAMAEGNDIAASVASATRPPGKYTLKWDGKDNAGKPVKPGKYTVCIEVTREHGTYQVYRQEMDFTGKANLITLAPNEEVAAAALEYAKKGHQP